MTQPTNHPLRFPDIGRVLVCGDSHANTGYVQNVIRIAAEVGAGAVLQVGDFGYWPRTTFGQAFLRKVSKTAVEEDVGVFFCDGNHEDHSRLDQDAEAPVPVVPSVFHVPRGQILQFGETKTMFYGGAVSVDQDGRYPGVDWFPEEIPNQAQYMRAVAAAQEIGVDMVVAHDVPTGVDLHLPMRISERLERASAQNREHMRAVCEAADPQLWLAGHYHQRASGQVAETRVEVLDCEYPVESSVVEVDTVTRDVTDISTVRARQT